MSASSPAGRRQFLGFSIADSGYGVDILQVREILQVEAITTVPSVPRHIRGVINLRGTVVPVVDLALKLGLPQTPLTKRTCILIVDARVRGEPAALGVLADSVSEVLELAPEEIEPPPAFGTEVSVNALLGLGKVGKGFVLLLDLDRVLSAEEGELAARDASPPATGGGPAPGRSPVSAGEPAPADRPPPSPPRRAGTSPGASSPSG
jgi:purine-binding chemotaxis protein CheW